MMRARDLLLLGSLALVGCASTTTQPLSPQIATAPAGDPALADTIAKADAHKGRGVRWGGRVVAIGTDAESRWFRVQARPLDQNGKPDPNGTALGYFRVNDKADRPVDGLGTGAEVTVAGTFIGVSIENEEILPIVRSSRIHVWHHYPSYAYASVTPTPAEQSDRYSRDVHPDHRDPYYAYPYYRYPSYRYPYYRYPYYRYPYYGYSYYRYPYPRFPPYRYYPYRYRYPHFVPYGHYGYGYGRFRGPFGPWYGYPRFGRFGYGHGYGSGAYLNFGFGFSN